MIDTGTKCRKTRNTMGASPRWDRRKAPDWGDPIGFGGLCQFVCILQQLATAGNYINHTFQRSVRSVTYGCASAQRALVLSYWSGVNRCRSRWGDSSEIGAPSAQRMVKPSVKPDF